MTITYLAKKLTPEERKDRISSRLGIMVQVSKSIEREMESLSSFSGRLNTVSEPKRKDYIHPAEEGFTGGYKDDDGIMYEIQIRKKQ